MSEEKDQATMDAEQAAGFDSGSEDLRGIVPQLEPTPGLPERQAVRRRKARVMRNLHTLPLTAQQAIMSTMDPVR
ncbi:hypothetical protein BU204_26675 [Actinophytocola xanthii]|uniref:Uncharacterized protein n=1 Tax=Actinophytocola xanthii TaxID=1912961 RepID=A0A1Q8CGX0_9PSEU|nr:hypothetical protein BU204_26675 [Actinophytocola xanthii]